MKVSPPSSPMPAKEHVNEPQHDNNLDSTNNCSKRRRLHSQTNIIINGHYRHRKHIYPRDEDKSSSMDCFDAISNSVNGNSNSSFNSSNSGEDASDCDDSSMMPSSYPNQQQHPVGETSSPPPNHNKKDGYRQTAVVNHIRCNNEEDCMTPAAIRNAVQKLATNSDNSITLSLSTNSEKNNESEPNNITHELTVSTRSDEHQIKSEPIIEKNLSAINTDFDEPAITANDCINSEISNDECLSQSPLNLTRSQGSSEGGNKSEDEDDGDYDDETEVKNGFGNDTNEDESIVNGHSLPATEVPFPWNIALGNNNKQKHQSQDDKVTAQPPQLLLTSGHLTTGCLQAAQLLIPTARGIMTQTILAIPINDMVSSASTTSNQQHLHQQLLYHSTNNVGQKSINRQQLNQTCPPSLSLPLSRYFQQQQQSSAADDTTSMTGTNDNADNNNYDAMANDGTISADQYNNIQQRKWQSPDLASKKHSFISPQQKLLPRAKNGESGELMNAAHRSKESSTIQTPASTSADGRIYSTNNSASITTAMTPMSPPPVRRNGSNNGGGVDVIQRQTVWPTAVTAADQHNGGDDNDNEGDKQQQPSHAISSASPTSSTNINTLKSLAPPASKLNCHIKPPKDEDSAAAAVAAAAYNQQNAICTALATHMLCASQLAAAQQPMFDNLDNGNGVKKSNHVYNNNNNNSLKSNNMMGVVNPAVLEKWMMEERYYYNNNNNNNKNIAGGHNHHQRYNAAAAAAAAAAAVELLSSGVSASSSGGGADSLASCKKRKRRTSFTPHALELLNGHFERNTHPSGSEITGLAHRLGYEREVIRIWFCNKRQALKNTVRTITGNGPTHMTSTKSHNNTSGY